MLKHLTFPDYTLNAHAQWSYTRIRLAQEFPGWTLDYIDSLNYANRANIYAVLEAQAKAKQKDQS